MGMSIGFDVYFKNAVKLDKVSKRINLANAENPKWSDNWMSGRNEFSDAWASFFQGIYRPGKPSMFHSPTFYEELDEYQNVTPAPYASMDDYVNVFCYVPFEEFDKAVTQAMDEYRETYIETSIERIADDEKRIAHLEQLQQGPTVTAIAFDKWQGQIDELRDEIAGEKEELARCQSELASWCAFRAEMKKAYNDKDCYVVPFCG